MDAPTEQGSSDFLIGSKTTRMSTVLNFRRFINDRLAAAAREIFGVFEQTVAELEKEMERQQKAHTVDTAILRNTPEVKQLPVDKDQIPCGQRDLNIRLDPVKEECLQRREEEQNAKFPFNVLVVKVGDDRGTRFPGVTGRVENEQGTKSLPLRLEQIRSGQPSSVLDGAIGERTSNLNLDSPQHTECSTDDSKDWMEMHVLESNSEKINNPVDSPITCSGCDITFTHHNSFAQHRKMCSSKNLTCSLCGECFTLRKDLSIHMRTHTRETPNSCSQPITCFPSTGSSVTICYKKKRFCCSECGKWFTQAGVLNRHKRIHTGETPYGCSDCGRRFRRKDEMLRHQRNHKEKDQNEVLSVQI